MTKLRNQFGNTEVSTVCFSKYEQILSFTLFISCAKDATAQTLTKLDKIN